MGQWYSRGQRLERVRFGIPLDQLCKNDTIPEPLLAMILKLNKEAPYCRNVFRAPGHEANVKRIIHCLQKGEVITNEGLSVYNLASVIKKFLRKLPGGVFGSDNEEELFSVMELTNQEDRFKKINRVMMSLPISTQHVLVLLFGTFRVIADAAAWADTGMTSEALGVSIAPSIFRSCVSDGKMATMEDVIRFKIATQLTKYLIDQFGHHLLFTPSCYEFYTQITGRPRPGVRDWRRGIYTSVSVMPGPPMIPARSGNNHDLQKDTPGKRSLYSDISPISPNGSSDEVASSPAVSLEERQLKAANRQAESTRELTFLPQVHERQAARLRSRLEWYCSPGSSPAIFSCTKQTETQPDQGGAVPNKGKVTCSMSA